MKGFFSSQSRAEEQGRCGTNSELLLTPHIHRSQKRLPFQIPVSADTILGSENGTFGWVHTEVSPRKEFWSSHSVCSVLTVEQTHPKMFQKSHIQPSPAQQGLQHLLSHSDIAPGLPKMNTQHFFKPGVLDILLSGQKISLAPPGSFSTLCHQGKAQTPTEPQRKPSPFALSLLTKITLTAFSEHVLPPEL